MSEITPVGAVEKCRFAFVERRLTAAERERYEDGGALPSGVGYDPSTVKAETQEPQEPIETVEGAAVVREGKGEYHVLVPVARGGVWRYRGRGYNGSGEGVVATLWQTFRGG